MSLRRLLFPLLAAAIALAAAPAAHAAWFPAETLDGPGADVVSVAGVDIARDGTGALVYIKRDGGVPHVFVSRLAGGSWRPAERVDAGLATPAVGAAVAVGEEGRLAVVWTSAGRLYGSVAAGAGVAALAGPTLLGEAAGEDVAIDMGINGTAYAVVASPGGGGSDVRVVRLTATLWEAVAAPLDIDPAQPAGEGARRARVGVSAEGNAVVVWGEGAAAYSRRVTGLTPSAAPQPLSVPDLGGVLGGAADHPDIGIEDDGSFAWAVVRQEFAGVPRAYARRLRGSTYDPPVPVDGGNAVGAPRIALNGRGVGHTVAPAPALSAVAGAFLDQLDVFQPTARLDAPAAVAAPEPAVAISERRQVVATWRVDAGGGATGVQARLKGAEDEPFQPEVTLSDPAFGPVLAGAPAVSSDRIGDFAVAFVQGPPEARRLVVASYDRPPAIPLGLTGTRFQRRSRPLLRWRPADEVWGGLQFRLILDGVADARTTTDYAAAPAVKVADGVHRWRVAAVDRRGQATLSKERLVRVDARPPRLKVKLSGPRKRGRRLKVSVGAFDGKGSGVARVSVRYGDGARTSGGTSVHAYRRPGRFTIVVRVSDRAGNAARTSVRVRIKK